MTGGSLAQHRLRVAVAVALLAGAAALAYVARSGSQEAGVPSPGDTEADDTPLPSADPPTTTTSSTTAAAPSTTVVATTEAPTTSAPTYRASIATVTVEQLGASWSPDIAACARPEDLRELTVSHWGYGGQVHEGRIVVHAAHAEAVAGAFGQIFEARFPIERMEPIAAYGGDDGASMRANNTSGFNCRFVAGTTRVSEHALGQAIDVNPLHNPYVRGESVDPLEGARWADRTLGEPGMITADDPVVAAFAEIGWTWGGTWRSGQDHQHFSAGGR